MTYTNKPVLWIDHNNNINSIIKRNVSLKLFMEYTNANYLKHTIKASNMHHLLKEIADVEAEKQGNNIAE